MNLSNDDKQLECVNEERCVCVCVLIRQIQSKDEDNISLQRSLQAAEKDHGYFRLMAQKLVDRVRVRARVRNATKELEKREEMIDLLAKAAIDATESTLRQSLQSAKQPIDAKKLTPGTKISKVEERAMSVNQLLDVLKIINARCHAEDWRDRDQKRLKPSTVTLYDLNKYVILPNTTKDMCSYVETVAKGPQPADWFVSHWWGEPVIDFVSCVRQHAIDHCYSFDHKYYWVCAYANNQHKLDEAHLNDIEKSSFMEAMKQADSKVLSVVDRDAKKYTRIWCGLEVYKGMHGIYEVYSVPDVGSPCKAYDIDLYKNFVLDIDAGRTNNDVWKEVEGKLEKSLQTRTAVGITVGLAENDGDENLRFGKIKAFREKYFPIKALQKIMRVKIEDCVATFDEDKTRILKYIKESSKLDDNVYAEFDNKLKGKMIASTWRFLVEHEDIDKDYNMQNYADALRKSGVERITLSMCGCKKFDDDALKILVDALPDELKVFELEASDSEITKGDYLLHTIVDETRSKYLRQLVIPNCKLSCDLPAMISKLTKLECLRLECNSLTGRIPEDIGNCKELKHMYLFDNKNLSGEIPKSIGKLTKLERLHIGHSNYIGEIPKEIGLCTSLETSFMGYNQLTGSLPPVGKLPKIRVIFLNDNQFDGGILPEIGNCVSLEVLFLHNNNLKGPLPEELSKCTKLHTLSLFGNNKLDAKSFYKVLEKCNLRILYIDNEQKDEIDSYCKKENLIVECKTDKEKDNKMDSDCAYESTRATHENLATSVNIFTQNDKYASGFGWDLALKYLPELFNEF